LVVGIGRVKHQLLGNATDVNLKVKKASI
jgi:hypothetical protein